ncbi:MAG TPA: uridylate kinase [Methanotrichaceae archaeon]|nr:uridylate kinase [Methanotrichaceae archaeon]
MRSLGRISGHGFLVVPGGGPMADLVRELWSMGQLSLEASHWMAVLAMEQYAYLLADGTGAAMTDKVGRVSGVAVLRPYSSLQVDDAGLEHTWEYTSDAVAALAAARLDVDLIKLTDVSGVLIGGRQAEVVAASDMLGIPSCIDNGALRILIQSGRSARVLDGRDPSKLADLILFGQGGTTILGR